MKTIAYSGLEATIMFIFIVLLLSACTDKKPSKEIEKTSMKEIPWQGWSKDFISPQDSLVRYGYELISNTSQYLGPKGSVAQISNGMNCQNCHISGGTVPWGNNYSAVVSTYPKFRDRSGGMETIPKRINDCFERSLNGRALDSNSLEMKSIVAYMHWVGDDIPQGEKPTGSGIKELAFLDRAADPNKGRTVYINSCQNCHGNNGEGQLNISGTGYTYPPLWGANSYNEGAGLYRISRLAGFVKTNMPFLLATYNHPVLSDEESWDVAAYINSQPRPGKDISQDWPDISKKPIDHPFGPYSDGFSEDQHKFGPFQPIKEARDSRKKTALK